MAGFNLFAKPAPAALTPADILNFQIPQANSTGQSDSYDVPRWLYDLAAPKTKIDLLGGIGGRQFTPGSGAVGDTTYMLGDTIYSGSHTGGYDTGPSTSIARALDPNSFVSYANSPAYKQALKTGQWTLLNGTPYNVLDANGNVIGTKNFTGLENEDNMDEIMMALTGAAIGGMGLTAASGGAGAGTAGTAGGTSTMGAAPSSFGVVDGSVGAGVGGSTGTGLTFGGGTTGLSAGAGQGLALSNGATGIGMTGASSGAGAIGGGLGTGFAGGSGTLLGPAALAGTTTLANGTILPAASAGTASMGSGAAGAAGSGAAGSGGTAAGAGSSLIPGVSNQALGAGASVVGGLLGSQGQSADTSTTRQLPGFLQSPVASDLVPRTRGLLNTQMPTAQTAGNQLMSVGSGLLGQTAPTTASNPYLKSVADDLQRRTAEMLAQNNLSIQGNAVATGGLGGSRQGVAQGIAAGQAADNLQGNVANLYGNAFNQDQNRLLQQQTLGAGLISQGLNTPFQPLQSATQIYSPFTGFGTSTQNTSSGGGAMGAVGGALGAAQFGHNMGWW